MKQFYWSDDISVMMRLVLQSPGASTLCILEVRVRPSRHVCCKAWLCRAITDAEEPSVNSARSSDRLPCTAAEKKTMDM